MRELDDESLDNIVGGVGNNAESNVEKWAKVGIRLVETGIFPEYYLISDGTKISPSKALEIYNAGK